MSGKELDPKMLILNLQDYLLEGAAHRAAAPAEGQAGNGHAAPMVGGVIKDNVLWACTTCRWCVEACPVFIEHVPKIVDMRRWLVLTESPLPRRAGPHVPQPREQRQPFSMALADARGLGRRTSACASWPTWRRPSTSTGSAAAAPSTSATEGRARVRQAPEGRGRGLRDPRQRGEVHRRAGAAPGQRVPLPDARPGQHRDPQAVPVQEDRHGLPALLQHHQERVPGLRRQLRGASTTAAPRRAGALGPAPARSRGRAAGDLPRRVQPRSLQRHLRSAARA